MQIDVCYRIAKEAGMAHEGKTKEPCEAYARLTFDVSRVPDQEEYAYLQEKGRKTIHRTAGIALEHLTPITFDEYMREVEEETGEAEIWN